MRARVSRFSPEPHQLRRYMTERPFVELLKQAYKSNKPSFIPGLFSGDKWRHRSVGFTLERVTEPVYLRHLQHQSELNLREWERNKQRLPNKVEVKQQDWGIATEQATRTYGMVYPVLNMANARYPGGGVLEGKSAQEENMFHRSTSLITLVYPGVEFDPQENMFRYDELNSKLVNALEHMSQAEFDLLCDKVGKKLDLAFKVLLHPQRQVCFRGPEIMFEEPSDSGSTGRWVADSGLSFSEMSSDRWFPFFELRSAAPDLSSRPINRSDKFQVENYREDLRRRIAAQLNTAILADKPNLILGAWGCGSFRNDAKEVSSIYREEIEKRAEHFGHILFPIQTTNDRSAYNFNVFHECLDGLELGPKVQLSDESKKAIHLGTRSRFFKKPLHHESGEMLVDKDSKSSLKQS